MNKSKISRYCVLKLIASCRILFNNKVQLEVLLETSIFDEKNVEAKVLEAIFVLYKGVSNGYLSEVYEAITGDRLEVIGEVSKLFQCPCCGHKTLTELYDPKMGTGYDICAYCNWEDEGVLAINRHSSINKGSIADYRKRIQENPNFYHREKWF